jgi:signal transduction histidine kinase
VGISDYARDLFRMLKGRAGSGASVRFGLAFKTSILVLASLIIFGIISGFIIKRQYSSALKADLVSKGDTIAHAFVRSFSHDPLSVKEGSFQDLLEDFLPIEGVAYLYLTDSRGEVIAHTFNKPFPKVLGLLDGRSILTDQKKSVREIKLFRVGRVIDVGVPFLFNGSWIVHVGMDRGIIKAQLGSVQMIVTSIFMVGVLCATSVAVFIYFLAIRPLRELTHSATEIGRERFHVKTTITSRDEIGALARAIEEMAYNLERSHDELKRKTRQIGISREELQRQNEELMAATVELKKAQDHLIKSEKFASMGQLAASVAHEVNNPLAGILTYIKLLLRKSENISDFMGNIYTYRKYLRTMEKETERCGTIVKNLLDFSRSSSADFKEVDINQVIEETLTFIEYQLITSNIELRKRLMPIPPVVADFSQLNQVFLNIILNAIEAMNDGHKLITVTTGFNRQKKEVRIRVIDTGEGVSPENLYRIYDPFFTTKEKGTGMGLSVVYQIIDKHQGEIHIDSKLGKGTTVTIELPVALNWRGEAFPVGDETSPKEEERWLR